MNSTSQREVGIMGQIFTAPGFTVATMVYGAALGAASLVTVVAPATAQPANSASSASLLGVQERSVQASTAQTQVAPRSPQTQAIDPAPAPPTTLYRLDSKTRVIMAPVAGASTDPMEIPIAGSTGDNRIQLQHDLQQ
jgi:hypothetical protein